MNVKIDTKEKFHVITINETTITANMTVELEQCLLSFLQNNVKNVILQCKDIQNLSNAAAECLVKNQQQFYEQHASFVICELQPSIQKSLDKLGFLALINITPTQSEAADIIQMEEIERELMDDDDPQFII